VLDHGSRFAASVIRFVVDRDVDHGAALLAETVEPPRDPLRVQMIAHAVQVVDDQRFRRRRDVTHFAYLLLACAGALGVGLARVHAPEPCFQNGLIDRARCFGKHAWLYAIQART
jgi:hypothetical protein